MRIVDEMAILRVEVERKMTVARVRKAARRTRRGETGRLQGHRR